MSMEDTSGKKVTAETVAPATPAGEEADSRNHSSTGPLDVSAALAAALDVKGYAARDENGDFLSSAEILARVEAAQRRLKEEEAAATVSTDAQAKRDSEKDEDVPGQVSCEGQAAQAEPQPVAVKAESAPAETKKERKAEEDDELGGEMGLMDHMREVRRLLCRCLAAIFIGFIGVFCYVEPVMDFFTSPLLQALPKGSHAIYTTLPEAFFVRMLIALVGGIFICSPYIFYELWKFISPGLYKEEKSCIIPIALVSAIFFIGGGVFCYLVVFKFAFQFFIGFSTEQIVTMPRIADYIEFVIKLIFAFGLIFEMPIFAFFLSRMGVVTAEMMRSFRRYSVLITFIVAAILTPPDVISQLLMAGPMLLLYEVSIIVALIFGRKPKKEDADEVGEDSGEKVEGKA